MERILVTGSLGQIGTALVERLRQDYGVDNVLATDVREDVHSTVVQNGRFQVLDVLDDDAFEQIVKDGNFDTIIHLAAMLSAVCEDKPQGAWNLNIGGMINALELARMYDLQFFAPSSIGAFGPNTPKDHTPQDTIQRPTTMYGVTKVSGELLADYYYEKFGVDTRGVRFPGLISYEQEPGGGTTDYAVDIFYKALADGQYTSFIAEGTKMDMMYMPDAVQAIIDLMEAPAENLQHRNAFNVSAMSFAPEDIAAAIKKEIPSFKMQYDVDPVRQGIADSWPNSLDVSAAENEWGFNPTYDLKKMVRDMLEHLSE
ncbi:L-threonine 3-dehydrogenase [Dolosigranulum pigrum]|uniref:L-threonine 3-dehydrogenase n=1 Tax=Dolosigranulum pigrum TaxID=29394 RepID=UPI001AD88BDC|nr:L-threonine 3-dehydrogenase [Dolosigranulum pigrum]QTJ60304.1 L-threonine 3-dehydrogenase [Dolosigranulum pigrum]